MDSLELARACAADMYSKDNASRALGIKVSVERPGESTASMSVRPDMVNGHALCHGGLIFSLADTAFAFACNAYDDVTVAAGASIDFVRPAQLGDELVASAREKHRGRRNGLYEVEVRNQDDQLIALFQGRSASLGRPTLSHNDTQ